MRKLLLSSALAGALVPFTVKADFDISPAVQGGKIVTNAFADADSTSIDNVRVFTFEFGEDPLDPYFLEDPGFHPLPGAGFDEGVIVAAKTFSPLSFWNDSGFVPAPAGETIDVTRGSTTITLGDSGFAGSLPIAATDANGEFDEHLSATLQGVTPALPSTGIYLYSLTLSGSDLTDSDSVYLLFNNGADASELGEAAVLARDTFAPGTALVPEPASLASLAVTGVLAGRRRRR